MDGDVVPIELARALFYHEDLEDALRDVVRDLLSDGWRSPSPSGHRDSVVGRPGWWWKVRLLSWAGSTAAFHRCDGDVLRAFRMFLRNLDDNQVCFLVETLLPHGEGQADVA